MVMGARPSASAFFDSRLRSVSTARDVGAIVLEDVRDGVPRLRQPVRRRPAHAAHRLALDRSPTAEIGQRRRRGGRRPRLRPPQTTAAARAR